MSKILIAYFTASGETRKAAERLAKLSGGDLFEIVPETPYTDTDVNYHNPLARCNKEWALRRKVPAAGKAPHFEDYDLVLIGFPIWYGCAPLVVNSFAELHDFTGKRAAIFATSIMSKMGKSAAKLQPHIKGTQITGERRILAEDTDEDLKAWLKSL